MKREDWLAKGFTEEQVTDILNQFHEVNNENKLLKGEKDKNDQLVNQNQELQKQLDEINKANMTEQERIANERAEADKYLSNAKKINNTAKVKEILAGENIDENLIARLVTDDEQESINNATLFKTTLNNLKETTEKLTKESIINTPVKPNPTNIPQQDDGIMTPERFSKMTMTEQTLWKRENAQEYENMFNN